VLRLLQALLASVMLAVVIAPVAGATATCDVSVMLAEPPGGSPPPALRLTTCGAISRVSPRDRVATYVRSMAPASLWPSITLIVRDLLRVTRRILC